MRARASSFDSLLRQVPRAFDDIVDGKRILREIKLMKFCNHENVRNPPATLSLSHFESCLTVLLPQICVVRDVLPPPGGMEAFDDVYIVLDLMDTDLHQVCEAQFFSKLIPCGWFFRHCTPHPVLLQIIRSKQGLSDDHVQYFLYQVNICGLLFFESFPAAAFAKYSANFHFDQL